MNRVESSFENNAFEVNWVGGGGVLTVYAIIICNACVQQSNPLMKLVVYNSEIKIDVSQQFPRTANVKNSRDQVPAVRFAV